MNEERAMIRETLRLFFQQELHPKVPSCDVDGRFPMEVYRKLGKEGFLGVPYPQPYGVGGDLFSLAILAEEAARVDPGFSLSMGASIMLFGLNVMREGSDEQREKYIPGIASGEKVGCWALTEPEAGSDALGIRTSATRRGDDFVLSGQKTFITNAPIADYFIILARTSGVPGEIGGGTAFILERGMPGLSTGNALDKMGMRSSPTGEIFLDECVVPASHVLGVPDTAFRSMMLSLELERTVISFISLGIAKACIEICTEYAQHRKQFGKPIAQFQLIQSKLAAMVRDEAVARAYANATLEKAARNERITAQSAITKWFTTESATRIALDAIQILGGYGYTREYGVEKLARDAKLMEIGAGTSEIMQLLTARELLSG